MDRRVSATCCHGARVVAALGCAKTVQNVAATIAPADFGACARAFRSQCTLRLAVLGGLAARLLLLILGQGALESAVSRPAAPATRRRVTAVFAGGQAVLQRQIERLREGRAAEVEPRRPANG